MAEVIKMPKMSDTMEEGVIVNWLKKEGDAIKSGDILAEVETDKATMELEAYEDGTLLYIGVKEKEAVPVDALIAIIGEKGEDISSLLDSTKEVNGNSEKSQSSEVDEKVDTSNINAELIKMPKMSDTMEEGVIVNWLKKVGDAIKSGDILAEIETDKATMELEAYEDGTLLYIGAQAGESIPVDGVLAVIGEKGEDYEALIKANNSTKKESQVSAEQKEEVSNKAKDITATTQQSKPSSSSDGRIKASPLAKKMAKELGYDLAQIQGSGDHGRIVRRDIENFKQQTPVTLPSVALGQESFEEVPISQMRKTIAKRLAQSKFEAPHFYLTMEINMDKAVGARKGINEYSPIKISFNDIVVKAVAVALKKHPEVNASWLGDKIRYNHHVHIGIAVAVEEGLLVPVVRFADTKSLSQLASETKSLGQKAKEKALQPQDWEGNTFTISNLGMFGIEEFTAIINPPDACILAVGAIKETAVVKNGSLVPGHVMKVTLSCDHRVVDGAVGSAFLVTLKQLLEDPIKILV